MPAIIFFASARQADNFFSCVWSPEIVFVSACVVVGLDVGELVGEEVESATGKVFEQPEAVVPPLPELIGRQSLKLVSAKSGAVTVESAGVFFGVVAIRPAKESVG